MHLVCWRLPTVDPEDCHYWCTTWLMSHSRAPNSPHQSRPRHPTRLRDQRLRSLFVSMKYFCLECCGLVQPQNFSNKLCCWSQSGFDPSNDSDLHWHTILASSTLWSLNTETLLSGWQHLMNGCTMKKLIKGGVNYKEKHIWRCF